MAELSSYEADCRVDPELRSFDTSRTAQVIRTLSGGGFEVRMLSGGSVEVHILAGSGIEAHILSLDSPEEVTECLLEMNQEIVNVKLVRECRKDIWRNRELFELVEDYFENSLLNFCTALDNWLKCAPDSRLVILEALRQFQGEQEIGTNNYARTLEELKSLKAAGDPFAEEFLRTFQDAYRKQKLMFEKLRLKREKLDKELKCVRAWRKVSCMMFAAAVTAILICSVVAAVMAARPVAAVLSAVTSIPLGSVGKWIDSLLKSYEDAMKGQGEVISSLCAGTCIAIKDLNMIRVHVDRLKIDIEWLLGNAVSGFSEEGALRVAMEDIKKNMVDLRLQADNCSMDIGKARIMVLRRVIKHLKQ